MFSFQFLDVEIFVTLPPKLRKFSQNYTKKFQKIPKFQVEKSKFSLKKKEEKTLVVSVNMVSSQQGVKLVKLIKHSQTLQQNDELCTGLSTINQQK